MLFVMKCAALPCRQPYQVQLPVSSQCGGLARVCSTGHAESSIWPANSPINFSYLYLYKTLAWHMCALQCTLPHQLQSVRPALAQACCNLGRAIQILLTSWMTDMGVLQ